MAITVARGTITRMRENYDSVLLRVEDADDPEAAARGLQQAIVPISDLGTACISDVMATPEGPALWVDTIGVAPEHFRTILDIAARHLEAAGVGQATIAFPEQTTTLPIIEFIPRCVALRLYGAPPPPPPPDGPVPGSWAEFQLVALPDAWVEEAAAWVSGGKAPTDELWVRRAFVEFTVAAVDAGQFLRQGGGLVVAAKAPGPRPTDRQKLRAGLGYEQDLAETASRLGRRLRGAAVDPGSSVVLAAGGPDLSDDELLAVFERFRDLARRLAPDVAWGYIRIDDSCRALLSEMVPLGSDPRRADHPFGPPLYWHIGAGETFLRDELVFDAFPYQILGPGHLSRFETPPAGSDPLPGGRVEVAIGEPAAWLLDPTAARKTVFDPLLNSFPTRDPEILTRARSLLEPVLPTNDRVSALRRFGFPQ